MELETVLWQQLEPIRELHDCFCLDDFEPIVINRAVYLARAASSTVARNGAVPKNASVRSFDTATTRLPVLLQANPFTAS